MKVAERLLDRSRVRVATPVECALAGGLLGGVDVGGAGFVSEEEWRQRLLERADVIAAGEEGRRLLVCRDVARKVAACISRRGRWTEEVEDSVPAEIQPLHMSAVKEALGALIPERLGRSLDDAVTKGKDDFGALRGGTVLRMAEWRVNVFQLGIEDGLLYFPEIQQPVVLSKTRTPGKQVTMFYGQV